MKALIIISLLSISLLVTSCGGDKVKKQTDQNYTIGIAKMDVKDYPGAVTAFSKCIGLNPNNYDAYHQRALAYKAEGNKKKALNNYKMAQSIMEKHEDLTQSAKRTEYQSLLQEIKDYQTAADVPVTTPPTGNATAPGTSTPDTSSGGE